MSELTTIAQAVADLVAADAAVLCLDTCDFLDVVRGVAEGFLFQVESFRRMQERLATDPQSFQVVVTYLVRHEWEQNKDDAIKKVDEFLRDLARSIARVGQARRLAGLSESSGDDTIVDPALSRTLLDLAETILNHSIVLEKDDVCIANALQRVMDRRRPSHQREIKDSIHWEHYLMFSSRLILSGHSQSRIFVSANKKDFWADRETSSIHPDLKNEADAAGLEFFGRLDLALRAMGV